MHLGPQLNWYQNLNQALPYWQESAKIDFAVQIDRMLARRNMSRSDFARAMGISPAFVSKCLRGDANLTIHTMAAMAFAVGGKLSISVTMRDAGKWLPAIGEMKAESASEAALWASVANNPRSSAAHELRIVAT